MKLKKTKMIIHLKVHKTKKTLGVCKYVPCKLRYGFKQRGKLLFTFYKITAVTPLSMKYVLWITYSSWIKRVQFSNLLLFFFLSFLISWLHYSFNNFFVFCLHLLYLFIYVIVDNFMFLYICLKKHNHFV